MRSLRSRFEFACRVGAFALLGWLLGSSLFPSTGRRSERASNSDIASRLSQWTRAQSNVALHVALENVPDPWIIDWLAALAHSGHAVTWSGSPPAVAMSAEALADPNGGVRVDVAAPERSKVIVRDDASVVDSIDVKGFGGTIVSPMVVGAIVAEVGRQRLVTRAPDTARLRSIVVVGNVSWEGKFIVSALEEGGWPVTARFHVAPNVEVGQSGSLQLDTSRVAAVVALDTTIQSLGESLVRFVQSGGGLILVGPASGARIIRPLVPGALLPRTRPVLHSTDTIRLGSTGFYPITSLQSDGVVLDRRADGVTVAARRVGAGRVLQLGYDDTWRWRMAGAATSETDHREWWSRVVASVAYLPGDTLGTFNQPASAPLAHLVDRLGPARLASSLTSRSPVDRRILLSLIMILLLAEWASRRLRGLR